MSRAEGSSFPMYEYPSMASSPSSFGSFDSLFDDGRLDWATPPGFANVVPSDEGTEGFHPDHFQAYMGFPGASNSTMQMNAVVEQHVGGYPGAVGDQEESSEDLSQYSSSPASGLETGSSPSIFPSHLMPTGSMAYDVSNNGSSGNPYQINPSMHTASQRTPQLSGPLPNSHFALGGYTNIAHPFVVPPTSAPANNQELMTTVVRNSDLNIQFQYSPSFSQLMNPENSNSDVDTEFSSFEDAQKQRYIAAKLPEDSTIPQTNMQKRAIVRAMCYAMSSTEHAQDNPGMIKPFVEGKYSARRIETACWSLLQGAIDRHTIGPLLGHYDVKAKHSGDSLTCGQRIMRIIECLATQKTICKHLLDPYYMCHLVDDPIAAHKRVIANKTLNKRKGEVMNAGKQMLGNTKPASGAGKSKSGKMPRPSTPTSVSQVGDIGQSLTPDGLPRCAVSAITLESPLASFPIRDSQSGTITPHNITASIPPARETQNLAHHIISRQGVPHTSHSHESHVRRYTMPTSHPNNGPPVPSHSRSQSSNMNSIGNMSNIGNIGNMGNMGSANNMENMNNVNNMGNMHTLPGEMTNENLHLTISLASVYPFGPRGVQPSGTTSTASRKRSPSEIEDAEACPSPEKRLC